MPGSTGYNRFIRNSSLSWAVNLWAIKLLVMNLIPYEEEILSLSLEERLSITKKIRQEQEAIVMSKIVLLLILINVAGIISCMLLILIKLL